MAREQLGLKTISELDMGRIAAAFDIEIERATRDLIDRPLDKTRRKVSLSVTLEPRCGDEGVCDEGGVTFHISSSIPKRKTRTYSAAINAKGKAYINQESTDNPHNMTIDEAIDNGQ